MNGNQVDHGWLARVCSRTGNARFSCGTVNSVNGILHEKRIGRLPAGLPGWTVLRSPAEIALTGWRSTLRL